MTEEAATVVEPIDMSVYLEEPFEGASLVQPYIPMDRVAVDQARGLQPRWVMRRTKAGDVRWVKVSRKREREERYSKEAVILEYSDEEYNACCVSPQWTREETDLLLSLCKQYALRFLIIEDRFHSEADKERTKSLEDIKTRFYAIQKALSTHRSLPIADLGEVEPYVTQPYDYTGDQTRRKGLIKVLSRTKEDQKRVAVAMLGYRSAEQQIDEMKEKDNRQIKLLHMVEKLRRVSNAMYDPPTPAPTKREKLKKSDEQFLSGLGPIVGSKDIIKDFAPGVHLRSQQPFQSLQVSGRVSRAIQSEMEGLGYPKDRYPLLVYSKLACDVYDEIRRDVAAQVNLHKFVARKEQELQQQRSAYNAMLLRKKYTDSKAPSEALSSQTAVNVDRHQSLEQSISSRLKKAIP